MNKIVLLNDENFTKEVLESNKLVLVDFSATWCGPCRMLAPVLDQVLLALDENIAVIGKLDIDESFDIAKSYKVMSVPTIIFFKEGIEVARMVGLRTKDSILEEAKKHI